MDGNPEVVAAGIGLAIALVMCILSCCSIIPLLGVLTGLAALVLWIIWWVKVAGYSSRLADSAAR